MSASPELRASELIYLEIQDSRYAVHRKHVELIKPVCDQMDKDNVEITLAKVVERTQPDGPAYSTVAPASSVLGKYIRARIDEQRAKIASRGTSSDSLSDAIRDPVLKAQVRDKESTARWLQKQNSGLRSLLMALKPGLDVDGIIRGTVDITAPLAPGPAKLAPPDSSTEIKAVLLKLLDHLIGSRSYRETRGRFTINNKVILDAHEMGTLRRATGLTDDQWAGRYGGESALGGQANG